MTEQMLWSLYAKIYYCSSFLDRPLDFEDSMQSDMAINLIWEGRKRLFRPRFELVLRNYSYRVYL
jgi:hypothetical protein